MYGEKMKVSEPKRLLSEQDKALLEMMNADIIRRAHTLDRLCEELEIAAFILDQRTKDLEMRENDLLRASLEMKKRLGAFSGRRD